MARLRFPPYGAALWKARSAGNHPEIIHVLVKGDVQAPALDCGWTCVDHPRIWIPPDEWERGKYDWRIVTGAQVAIFDFAEWYETNNPKLFDLVREVAHFSADVEILPAGFTLNGRPFGLSCALYAYSHRYPPFWSPEIEKVNSPRRVAWIRRYIENARRRFTGAI